MRGTAKSAVGKATMAAIRALRPIVEGLRQRAPALSEQLVRAMTNVALCIARADFPVDGNRRGQLFAALASAREAQAVLRVAVAGSYCSKQSVEVARGRLDETHAMLCRLVRSRAA